MWLRERIPIVKNPQQANDLVTSEGTKNMALAYLVRAEMHPLLHTRLHRIDKLGLSSPIVVNFAGPWGAAGKVS